MTIRVVYSARAESDLREMHAWASKGSESYAARWIDQFLAEIKALERFPERGRLAPENPFFSFVIRQILIGKGRSQYRILYTIQEDVVWILHIRHSMRRYLQEDPDDPGFDHGPNR